VDFLQRLDVSALRVFEYGAGASTLYFARRARQVVAVEHTMLWHDRVAAKLGHPHVVVFRPRGDTYAHEIESHGRFDIVVIDGVDRAECAMVARENLTPQGVMIWDDADRADYRETSPRLLADGYRQIIFAGMAPITFLSKGTAVIYRSGRNCMGI
jgi:predicted O-methyltransferase YrrM